MSTSISAWQRFTPAPSPAPLAPGLADEGLRLEPSIAFPSLLSLQASERERTWAAPYPKATAKVLRVHKVSSSTDLGSWSPSSSRGSEELPAGKSRPLLGAPEPA